MLQQVKPAIVRSVLSAVWILGGAMSAPAQALPSLESDDFVTSHLVAGIVGKRIAKFCDEIGPDYTAAYFGLQELKDYALSKGYSSEEIDAFIASEEQQKRLRKLAAAYLAEHGADKEDPASYCTLGQEEIATGSLIGNLLSR